MAVFEFTAIDGSGRRKRGVLTADSARAARTELRTRRLAPVRVEAVRHQIEERAKPGRLSSRERTLIVRQLAVLIQSSIPVEHALAAVAANADGKAARRLLLSVRTSVAEGQSLSKALARHPVAFSKLFRAIVAAGEVSGDLGGVMKRLADHEEKDRRARQKIQGALVYPILLLVTAFAVVVALMTFVVPKVVEQFAGLNQTLPLLTRIVIGASEVMRSWIGLAIVAAIVAGAVLIGLLRRGRGSPTIDGLLLRIPVFGQMIRDENAARFARTLSTLLSSRASLLDSLQACRGGATNLVFAKSVDAIAEQIREGVSLSRAMAGTKLFPGLLVHLAASGEASGSMGEVLGKGADHLEDEFESATRILLNILEPAIIIVLGGLVAVIVLAIMLPILQLNSFALQ